MKFLSQPFCTISSFNLFNYVSQSHTQQMHVESTNPEIHALFSNHHSVETNYFRHVLATDLVNPVLRKEAVSRVEQVVKRRVP